MTSKIMAFFYKKSLHKLLQLFSKKDKIKLSGLLFLMLIGSLLELLGLGTIPLFVSILTTPEKLIQIPYIGHFFDSIRIINNDKLIIIGAIIVVIAFISKNLFLIFLAYFRANFIYSQKVKLEKRLFKAYLLSPYYFILERNSSELLRNMGEITIIITRVLLPILVILLDSLIISVIIIFLFIANPYATLVILSVLSLLGLAFIRLIKNKISKYGKEEQENRETMFKSILEGLGGLKEIRVLNKEFYFLNSVMRSAKKLANAGRYREFIGSIPKPFIETSAIVIFLLIISVLFWGEKDIRTIAPMIALYAAALYRIMPTVQRILTQISVIRYGIISINPVFDDLKLLEMNLKATSTDKNMNESLISFNKNVEIKNLNFKYPRTKEKVLEDINLTLKKGQAIGFVGRSGAGKTTLVDLILGLLIPDHGNIYADGVNINHNIRSWTKKIGYIPQNIYLLDDSIKNNIALGLNEIEHDELARSLREAQLEEFIDNLPDGVETIIGERGVRLSGGQRQRIGIARALYHNPEVLIMDEATSSLDTKTEKFIIQSIDKLKKGRSFILIAHRLNTVKNCDMIYFFEKGRIKFSGTYDELIENQNDFRELAK